MLHQVLLAHLFTFLASEASSGLPAYVGRELRAVLSCGSFDRGAACFRCDGCGERTWLPLSCKTRSLCPSCCGRRMSDVAAHWVDQVLPQVQVRQWVLTVPIPVRFLILRNRALVGKVLAIMLRVIYAYLRGAAGVPALRSGALVVEQKFGDAAKLHWHIHALLPDGGYHRPVAGGPLVFVRTPAPGRDELAQMVVKIQRRVQRLLKNRGLSPEDLDDEGVESEGGVLGQLQAAALTGRVGVGERAGQRVVRVGGQGVVVPVIGQGLWADAHGYNLHAGVYVPAGQRERLEGLCRYLLRPPLARDRLSLLADGRVMVKLKRPYADGTRALIFEPMDFVARLAALVAPARVHLIHYAGVFAPHSSWRKEIVPGAPEADQGESEVATQDESQAPPPAKEPRRKARGGQRHLWAELMRRSFGLDVLTCACGGRLRLLCCVFRSEALAAISESLGRGRSSGGAARASPQMEWDWASP